MSYSILTKFGPAFRGRHRSVVNLLLSGSTKCHAIAASSASFTLSRHRDTHSSATCSQFRIEGIQGQFPAPLSLKKSKKILKRAAEQASQGFSQQGVQAFQLHTGHVHNNQAGRMGKMDSEWENTACPQGIQGDSQVHSDCGHFSTWFENCKKYGLAHCEQQLQGIQMGRLTLAQVLAQQEMLIVEIAESYRKRTLEQPDHDESMQGTVRLPEIDVPCPQGVQGQDCAQFKLWLENCHRFGLHDCRQQLQGFQSGRLSLAQLFAEQESTIKQVVQQYQQRRDYSTQIRGDGPESAASKQVGESTGPQLSQREKLKRAVKEYGSTVIVFHVTISLISLGGFYLAVSSGIDVVGILKSMGVGEAILQSKLATGTGTFVVAYAVHKVFAPVRIGITLTATPFIVRYLRSRGVLKVPKKVS